MKQMNRANKLPGKEWIKKSISIWTASKGKEERKLQHPAAFPVALVQDLLFCFARPDCRVVLDPFAGSGSTLVAACKAGYTAIGFELYQNYICQAKERLRFVKMLGGTYTIYNDNSINLLNYIKPESIDIVITSPPYWNILNRKRTADNKKNVNYGFNDNDIGNIDNYDFFLTKLTEIFKYVSVTLKSKSYCLINVMDIRVKSKFYTFHSDLYTQLEQNTNLFLDDIIIWDRRQDYNNLKPLGYPHKFRINRVHEYILIMQKR
jgi:DNA modification methylase